MPTEREANPGPQKKANGEDIPPLKLESYKADKDGSGGHLLKFLCPQETTEHIRNVQKGVVNTTHGAVAVYWKGQQLTPGRLVSYLGRGMVLAAPESLGGGGRRVFLEEGQDDLEAPLGELALGPARQKRQQNAQEAGPAEAHDQASGLVPTPGGSGEANDQASGLTPTEVVEATAEEGEHSGSEEEEDEVVEVDPGELSGPEEDFPPLPKPGQGNGKLNNKKTKKP